MTTNVFGLNEKLASLLAYALGFISGIVVLVLEKENKTVRFHALQSTIWFLALAVAGLVVGVVPILGWLVASVISLISFVSWLFLMFCAFSGKKFKIPIVGDVVEAQINK